MSVYDGPLPVPPARYEIIEVGGKFLVERDGESLPIGKPRRLFQFRSHAEYGIELDKQVEAEKRAVPTSQK